MRKLDENLISEVGEHIVRHQAEHGVSPTQRDIASKFKITQPRVFRVIHALRTRGILELNLDGSIDMPDKLDSSDTVQVALIGAVRCGSPTLAVSEFEAMYKLPRELTGSGNFFMLRAEGDSMIDADINEGDYLVIREQPTADCGDIVVAIKEESVDEVESTLKRYKHVNGQYVLRAENDNYEDIDFAGWRIVGKLVSSIRKH